MIRRLTGAVVAVVAIATLAASAPTSLLTRDASAQCVRDVSAPTAVATRPLTTGADDNVLVTPEAAVIAPRDDTAEPLVVGGPAGLAQALRGTRAWAASPEGLVVSTVVPSEADGPDEVIRLVREIHSDGTPAGLKRVLTGMSAAATWGGDILIRIPGAYTTLYRRVDDRDLPPGLRTTVSIASDIGLMIAGASGGVAARDGARIELDDLRDLGARGALTIGGVGRDRILIHEATPDGGSRYWVWVPAENRLAAIATTGPSDDGGAAVCGDLLYVVEDHELRVIDTSAGLEAGAAAIVSRYPLSPASASYSIDAVPGSLALSEYPGADLRVTWFHTP